MSHLDIILKKIEETPKQFLVITGPTCTGKTDLSIQVAQKLNIPIINCDSRLIFDEMNIGTAKPSEEEMQAAKHYMVNIKKPNETYSAGAYRDDFDKVANEIIDFDNPQTQAIVCGGTGLYLRSALENLDMPDVGRNFEMREELKQHSLEELQTMLLELDPHAHLQVDMPNKVRLIRAIEIVRTTGKPIAESRSKKSEPRYQANYFALNFERRRPLYDLINKRVIKMLNKGLVYEVEALMERYGVTETLLATIGYKEIVGYLQGEYSLSEGRRRIQKKTRVYAKRQMTWFRQNQEIEWLYHSDEVAKKALKS